MGAIQFDAVLERLERWRESVVEQLSDPASHAEALRVKLQIDDAIGCLALCERHQIRSDARVIQLPEPRNMTPSSEFRIIEDQESDQREYWIEAMIDGAPIRPVPGTLLLENRRR
jgi:hypothetical protein